MRGLAAFTRTLPLLNYLQVAFYSCSLPTRKTFEITFQMKVVNQLPNPKSSPLILIILNLPESFDSVK